MPTHTEHVIGFPRESTPGDRRALLTPNVARVLGEAGFTVVAESGIGAGVFCADADLAAQGVRFAEPNEVWAAPLVLRYKSTDPRELARLRPDQTIGALFHAEGDPALLSALTRSGVTAYSYEFVIEDARFPLAAPGGEIAGVQAVFHGAQALQTVQGGRGVLLAHITGAAAPRVVVIGCGNVGSAAARTAAALGAEVTVLARSEESANRYLSTGPPSVRVAVNTPDIRRVALTKADLVIGAILVSTFDTPPMITGADLRQMKPGAVIVDATCGYGDGYLPTAGPAQQPGEPPRVVEGVLHIKLDALPALVPVTTTEAYTTTIAPYLVRLARVALLDSADLAIESARIAQHGRLVHPVCRQHATHVAEIPCGAGHFLTHYALAKSTVTLVDANAAMLAVAVEHAAETGLDTDRTFPALSYLPDLPPLNDVDLVMVPNAALNQLAHQTPLTDLLVHLHASLRDGATVLAQIACTHPSGRVDEATFYTPNRQHEAWFTDRRFDPAHAGRAAVRLRRQHRDGNRLQIDFDYRAANGTSLHTTTVELTLFSAPQLIEAFHATGFTHIHFLPGENGLSEVVAGRPRR